MPHRFRLAAAGLLAVAASGIAHAADSETAATTRALDLIRAHAAETRFSDHDSFSLRGVVVDADGSQHVRLARQYKGLPVIGGDLVVHASADGAFRGASLTQREPLTLSTRAKLPAADAIALAEKTFQGEKTAATRQSLAVYTRGAKPALVHDVVVRGVRPDGTPSVAHFIVSTAKAQLIERWDEIHTDASNGTGNSLYAGTVTIGTDGVSSGFEMRDPTRGDQYTVDLGNRFFGRGSIVTDADNIWGDSTTDDRVTVAVDAHYGMQLTWDYYLSVLGRNGIAGDGQGAYSRVHYRRRYSNAYWSDDCFCMTYGDGDGRTLLPLVSLDIAGHEMTHGVTSNTAGLVYSGESGGLNEAISDIFGTMVEFHANSAEDVGDYLEGEEIYVANEGDPIPTTALRYLFKPSLDGTSPDCYYPGIGNIDVHYSSGVGNHFYYLLAEGAVVPAGFESLSPSDLVCNSNTTLTGIGRDAAAKIMYRALSVYMTSSTNYAQARTATLNAAADLYGSGSPEYAGVAAAWSAVSVN